MNSAPELKNNDAKLAWRIGIVRGFAVWDNSGCDGGVEVRKMEVVAMVSGGGASYGRQKRFINEVNYDESVKINNIIKSV